MREQNIRLFSRVIETLQAWRVSAWLLFTILTTDVDEGGAGDE